MIDSANFADRVYKIADVSEASSRRGGGVALTLRLCENEREYIFIFFFFCLFTSATRGDNSRRIKRSQFLRSYQRSENARLYVLYDLWNFGNLIVRCVQIDMRDIQYYFPRL